jgi:hypothetical protein
MKYFVSLLLLFHCCLTAAAQDDLYDSTVTITLDTTFNESYEENTATHQGVDPATLEGTREYQSKKIDVEKFDENKWKDIVGKEDFKEKEAEKEDEPVKENKPASDSNSSETRTPWGGSGLQVIFYVLVIGIVAFVLWAIMKNISLDVKLKKVEMSDDPTQGIENIERIDIDTYLEKARAEKNYRLAVRLYYLGLLKRLNTNGIITWKKDKTNLDYLNELYAKGFHFEETRLLTLAYEEVWYGERTLNDHTFHAITRRFEVFFEKLNTPSAA